MFVTVLPVSVNHIPVKGLYCYVQVNSAQPLTISLGVYRLSQT